jgi:hypothetical protein
MSAVTPIPLQQRYWNQWNAPHREKAIDEPSKRQAKVVGEWRSALRSEAANLAADLSPVLVDLKAAGIASTPATTRELNDRAIPTPTGRRWHQTSVVGALRLARS